MTTEEILRRFENQIYSLNDTGDLSEYGNNILGGLLVEIRNRLVKETDSLSGVSESDTIHECRRCEFDKKLGFCPKCDTDAYSR